MRSLKKLFRLLDSSARKRVSLLFIPMLISGLLEMLGIGMFLPVLQLFTQGSEGDHYLSILTRIAPPPTGMDLTIWVLGIFAALLAIKNAITLAMIFIINKTSAHIAADFTSRMFVHYIGQPITFHFQRNSAEILRNLTTGVDNTFAVVNRGMLILLEIIIMLSVFAVLLYAEPFTILVLGAFLVASAIIYHQLTHRHFTYWGEQLQNNDGELIKWINQALGGIRDIKILRLENFMERKIDATAHERAHYNSLFSSTIHVPRLMLEILMITGMLGIVGILLVQERDQAEIVAILGLFGLAGLRLMPSLNRILAGLSEIRHRAPFIDTLYADYNEIRSEVASINSCETLTEIHEDFSKLELDNVSYSYPSADGKSLKAINLSIRQGESIGIVGMSGAGKSTLSDIILGLLAPDEGYVLANGRDISKNLAAWQKRIGYVPQSVHLIDDSIKANIALGVSPDKRDDTQIEHCLDLVGLRDFVDSLPNGSDSIVGERGARLSGGQRQRVAIARALYRDPDILVLDEATSSLDNQTEQTIRDTIARLSGEKTLILIAHRLKTISDCNRLIFIERGAVVATAPYHELVKNHKGFRDMAAIEEQHSDS